MLLASEDIKQKQNEWTKVFVFQGSRRDQKILEEEGGAGPSILPRRDHQ